MKKIVLTGGGTAGHCTPHLALIPKLKKHFNEIIYIGSENGIEKEIIKKTRIEYYSVNCAKLSRSLTLKNLTIPFKVAKGIIQAKKILKTISPDVVFSKGGYVALPVVLAAHSLKIPVISHESDITVGLANKLSSRYSDKVLTSFPETAKTIKNGLFVGPPIRQSIFAVDKLTAIRSFNFNDNKPILLVTGGSQGAKAINDAVHRNLVTLLKTFNIIHVTGKGNLIKNTLNGYYQTEYMHNIEYAFSACDVCVSRAGSNTLFELLALKKNCLIIPLPKGNSRGDQVLNANYFKGLGLINVLEQEYINDNTFTQSILNTYKNREQLQINLKKHPIEDKSDEIVKILSQY